MNKQLFRTLCVLMFLVLLISAIVIYFTFDIRALNFLAMFKPWSILFALGMLFCGLFFDGCRLMTLADISDEKLSYHNVGNVVLSNYFLALLTPGASGGAIAQVMFMKKAGVSVPKATVIIFVRTIMSILFLFFLVPVIFYYDHTLIGWLPTGIIILFAVVFISIPLLCIFLMTTRYPEYWLAKLTKNFSDNTQRAIFLGYRDFREASFLIGHNPVRIIKAFIESGLSLLCIYSVVPVLFCGFGLDIPVFLTMGRMCLLNLVLYFTPTPGGTGVAEGGFVFLFSKLLPSGTVGIMAVLWRLFCEYIPFILGAIITIRAFGVNVLTKIKLRRPTE
ncbi:MAG: lysylphosphatidylglycerol synthase transmembrane domain-containing protein [Acidaminococcaceae bacterium]|nr:lysylphosphatidylglycerol synthase transmembrane domain-containing protein [Acidaminococcaceae bacterium]MDD4722723.1 lysylphosphatidylglycerol synthase transmembrane domain-containing protein [Acidaminococcaceae bacterium]